MKCRHRFRGATAAKKVKEEIGQFSIITGNRFRFKNLTNLHKASDETFCN